MAAHLASDSRSSCREGAASAAADVTHTANTSAIRADEFMSPFEARSPGYRCPLSRMPLGAARHIVVRQRKVRLSRIVCELDCRTYMWITLCVAQQHRSCFRVGIGKAVLQRAHRCPAQV